MASEERTYNISVRLLVICGCCKNNSCCKLARPDLLCPAIAKNQGGPGPCGPTPPFFPTPMTPFMKQNFCVRFCIIQIWNVHGLPVMGANSTVNLVPFAWTKHHVAMDR